MTMRTPVKLLTGLGVLALHALAFWMASHAALSVQSRLFQKTSPVVLVAIVPTLPEPALPKPLPPPPAQTPLTAVAPDKPLATLAAPPPPTAEEWAFAAQYTQKNSKGYRYSWGQQVRSMMGTAVEGPQQGVVRFRVVIAPSGQLAQLDTLWSTSAAAEQLELLVTELRVGGAKPMLPLIPAYSRDIVVGSAATGDVALQQAAEDIIAAPVVVPDGPDVEPLAQPRTSPRKTSRSSSARPRRRKEE